MAPVVQSFPSHTGPPEASSASAPPACHRARRAEGQADTMCGDGRKPEAEAAVGEGRGNNEQDDRGDARSSDEDGGCPGNHQQAADHARENAFPSWVTATGRRRGHDSTSPAAALSHGLVAVTAPGAAGTKRWLSLVPIVPHQPAANELGRAGPTGPIGLGNECPEAAVPSHDPPTDRSDHTTPAAAAVPDRAP